MKVKRTQVVHVLDRDEIRWHEQAEAPPILLGNGENEIKRNQIYEPDLFHSLITTIYWFFQSRPLDSIKNCWTVFTLSNYTQNQFYFLNPISLSPSTCLFPEKKNKNKNLRNRLTRRANSRTRFRLLRFCPYNCSAGQTVSFRVSTFKFRISLYLFFFFLKFSFTERETTENFRGLYERCVCRLGKKIPCVP